MCQQVPFPGLRELLSSAVDVSPMLNPMDYDDLFVLEDLVDDPVVATTGRSQAFELAEQWFTEPSWILGNGSEYAARAASRILAGS